MISRPAIPVNIAITAGVTTRGQLGGLTRRRDPMSSRGLGLPPS